MIPVYFPFTHVSTPIAEAVCRCFGGLIVYRPMEYDLKSRPDAAVEKPPVDIRVPIRDNDRRLSDLYHEYRKWGEFHEGGIGALKKRFDGIPDVETFVSQIRTDILGKHARRADIPDPLFSARLFLLAAQDYDMAQEAVEQTIAASEISMAKMVSELKGIAGPADFKNIHGPRADQGEMMAGARLLSWHRLASRDPEADFRFLITTSPAVCDILIQQVPSGRLVQSWDGLPCPADESQRTSWENYLTHVAGRKINDSEVMSVPEIPAAFARDFVFRLYLFPDITPEQLMCGAVSEDERTHSIQPGIGNILVGLLETGETEKRVLDSIL